MSEEIKGTEETLEGVDHHVHVPINESEWLGIPIKDHKATEKDIMEYLSKCHMGVGDGRPVGEMNHTELRKLVYDLMDSITNAHLEGRND